MLFGERILEYWDDIMKDLATLVAIPSVADPEKATPGHPFGDPCAQALDTILSLAEGYGLKTKNVDYYAGHAEYGEGDEDAAVMAHVDVVPAGEGWATDPFTLTIDGNRAFGRGAADDKGAAVVALHCLRALKDAGVKPKRRLRVIFGCAEEIGMGDMTHYFAKEPLPDLGFTPDAEYGVCHCEKGGLTYTVTGPNTSPVTSFAAGTVVNAVPAKATAHVACSPEQLIALQAAAAKSGISITVTPAGDGADLLAEGVAAHASLPWLGKNAATHLAEVLLETFGESLGDFFWYLHEKIGVTTDGSLAGVACEDEPSGPLTFNPGLFRIEDGECSLTVDIRYPATAKGADLAEILAGGVKEYPTLSFEVLHDSVPLYLPRESRLITLLSGAYTDVTGEPCRIFSMGGGTYARSMAGKGVAFGPFFPGQENNHEHDVNEQIELDRFQLHAKICCEAMYRLLTAD